MFERFTSEARQVVVLAQEESRLRNHHSIGTEHILLGLIHDGTGPAARALVSLGISLDAVRTQVEQRVGRASSAPSGHIPFTPGAKKVLEFSLREAMQLGHDYIGTEHILLGLIREGEGVAAHVLAGLGADVSRTRQAVMRVVAGAPVAADPEPAELGFASLGPWALSGLGPAACWFCGTTSPECGTLYTGARGALICERCVEQAGATPLTEPPEQPG